MESITVLASTQIPIDEGTLDLIVQPGLPIFILGRNGTGKSALVNLISARIRENLIYMPGSRPSYFENESLSITPASRRQLIDNLRHWDASSETRWKSPTGTSKNEKAIHDLQASETQYKIDAANQIKVEGTISDAIARLQSNNSPLDRVNALLAQGNLPIRMLIHQGELRAEQKDSIYSYARMSDGERAALLFAAEVVAAPAGTIFLIDEPELHLHPAIVVPLLKALISERPDCGFVVCTHELDLPGSVEESSLFLVRGSTWQNGEIEYWQIDALADPHEIPEWLRIDLIGSRRKILFIEGTSTSLDQPLYSLLFPTVSVRSRESCREVMRAVEGLRGVESLHRVEAFGLVDHDGMGGMRMAELEAKGIYPLPIYAVESLYYSEDVLKVLATHQAILLGFTAEELLSNAKSAAIAALTQPGVVEHLASRIAERQMRDTLMLSLPTRESMIQGGVSDINVSIASPYPQELALINRMISDEDVNAVVARYPVRESGVLNALARGLHFNSRTNYERATLTRIGADEDLQLALKGRLGNLSLVLN
ncbi:AAA family ATPase [Stutzerimonas stutzeri]|uniref:AAA family ATPase n=1 Tax=Stutzerimonas stutzeri TaxID=316 RepID=UPI000A6AE1C8